MFDLFGGVWDLEIWDLVCFLIDFKEKPKETIGFYMGFNQKPLESHRFCDGFQSETIGILYGIQWKPIGNHWLFQWVLIEKP